MSLRLTYSPTVPGGGAASYKLWPVFTYNNGYLEVYKPFQEDFSVGGRGWGEGATWEDLPMNQFVIREEGFHEGGAGFSSIILKKEWKDKFEKDFSTESKDQHWNLKWTEIITNMVGLSFPKYLAWLPKT